jgi:hypothetical protein
MRNGQPCPLPDGGIPVTPPFSRPPIRRLPQGPPAKSKFLAANFSGIRGDAAVELPETLGGKKLHREGGGFYLGENPGSPTVGDGLGPYTAKAGGTIEMLETGSKTADSMFATAHESNKLLTWFLRALGTVLMFFGFSAIFRPLSVLADVLPIAGDIVGAGTGFIAFLLTVVISFFVIAVAWIFYRPLIGIPLVLVAVAGLVFLVMKLMGQRKKQNALA